MCESLPSVLNIFDFPLSSSDVIAMRVILINRKMKLFLINNLHLTANQLRLLEPALRKTMPEEVFVACPNIGDEGIKTFATAMTGTHLRVLHLKLQKLVLNVLETHFNIVRYWKSCAFPTTQ